MLSQDLKILYIESPDIRVPGTELQKTWFHHGFKGVHVVHDSSDDIHEDDPMLQQQRVVLQLVVLDVPELEQSLEVGTDFEDLQEQNLPCLCLVLD